MRTIVVGASSGLGRSIAVDLAQRGEPVAMLARRLDRLEGAQKEAGGAAFPIRCDVTDEDSCRDAVAEAAEVLGGGIDAVVMASGVGPIGHIAEVDRDTWRWAFDTNVIGAARFTAHVVPYLEVSRGTIAYLSSITASMETPPRPNFAPYVVSKAALDKLVECWRVEHPSVGFTRVVMGDCMGGEGESMVELSAGWEGGIDNEILQGWMASGYVSGALIDVKDLITAVDAVLRNGAVIPSVTVYPRAAAG